MKDEFVGFSKPNSFFLNELSPLLPILYASFHFTRPTILLKLLHQKIVELINIQHLKSHYKSLERYLKIKLQKPILNLISPLNFPIPVQILLQNLQHLPHLLSFLTDSTNKPRLFRSIFYFGQQLMHTVQKNMLFLGNFYQDF